MPPHVSWSTVTDTSTQLIPYLVEQHAKGNYPIEELVSYYPVKDFEQAIKDTKEGKALKAVLRWS